MNLLLNLEKNVYACIAKKYNKNKKTVKSDINKATDRMYDIKCLKNPNMKLLKITPKMVINDIVEQIKNE